MDVNSNTHFENFNADAQGFSTSEMDFYAGEAGFKLMSKEGINKNIRLPGISTSTYYLATRFSPTALDFFEKILPTSWTNNIRIYMAS